MDKYWRRIKVKNPVYLQLHRMISNNQLKLADVIKMVLDNEQEEFLAYFPEYKKTFDDVERAFINMKKRLEGNYQKITTCSTQPMSRKDFALEVMRMDKENSSYYFMKNQKGVEFEDWVANMQIDKLAEKIKSKMLDD